MHLHITANTRLSQQLKQDLSTSENLVNQTPTIMTWQQWWSYWFEQALLNNQINISDQPKRTLNPFESQQKWQELLEELNPSYQLLNSQTTANQLYRAWELWHQYNQPSYDHGTKEWEVFQEISQTYTDWLTTHKLQDQSQQIQAYLNLALQGIGTQPQSVTWHGFNDYTPQMLAWQKFGTENSTSHKIATDTTPIQSKTSSFAAKNSQEETQQAIAFALDKLQQLIAQDRPLNTIKIGLVAPNIQDYKSQLTYQLDEQLFQTFANQPITPTHSTERLYNLSLGSPLPTRPYANYLVATLKMLYTQPSLDFQEFSNWLLNPYLPTAKASRATYDKFLRKNNWSTIYWSKLTQQSEPLLRETSPLKPLAKYLNQLDSLKQNLPTAKINLADFSNQLQTNLETIHQQTKLTLNSDEHQAYTRLTEALADFSKMHSFTARTARKWWQLLNLWLNNQTHQSKSTWPQPIQISGLLEAAGQKYDAVWLLGLDDQNFPSPAKPNAFLPLKLQRELRMPNCDSEKEREYAQQLISQLQTNSGQLILSYSKMQQEAQLMPSPLITEYPAQPPLPTHNLIHKCHQPDQITYQLDDQAPEIPKNTLLKGGTGLIDSQLKCPLMAFIDFRLNARNTLEEVTQGLDSADQGSLVHKVLENFWQETQSLAQLLLITEEQLDEQLEKLITQELAQPEYSKHNSKYLAQEKSRVKQLITHWLQLEKKRPTSFKVAANEQQATLKINDYQLQVKIDRIDTTENGKIIIDYKTGKASISSLTNGTSLQLASYLYHLTENPTAIAYGIINSNEGIKWSSVSATGDQLTKNNRQEKSWEKAQDKDPDIPSWEDSLAEHKANVAQVISDIGAGKAPMIFDKPSDLAYAKGQLALRLPEAQEQLVNQYLEED